MNVICNSCVGARIYELRNMQFNNPFMWNVIPYADFKQLILEYDTINFNNYDVGLFYQAEDNCVAQAVFDSKIKTYYIHYHQDEKYKTPTKKSIDVYSNNIVFYTKSIIDRRLERMHQQSERPIFLFETRNRNSYNGIYTEECIKNFIDLKTDYTKILLVNQLQFKDYSKTFGNCHVLYYEDKHPDLPPDTTHMAHVVYNEFKEIFDN